MFYWIDFYDIHPTVFSKEAEKENLFSYLKSLQTGEKLSKEELYGYEEEETLKELFQLEEKKRKEYSTEYWKLDLEQDGIEDLVLKRC